MSNPQSVGELPCLILPWGKSSGESAFQEWSETVATIFDLDATPESIDDFRFGFSAYHWARLCLASAKAIRSSSGARNKRSREQASTIIWFRFTRPAGCSRRQKARR